MYAKKIDKNQNQIIKHLEQYDVFIVRDMDDFMVYYESDKLTQVEVKNNTPFNKNGTIKKGFIKDSQYKMLWNANDNYIILWTAEQAMDWIIPDGIFCDERPIFPSDFKKHYKEWLTPSELKRLRDENIIQDGVK